MAVTKFNKRVFVEAMKLVVPGHYFQTDLELSGIDIDPKARIINGQITFANDPDKFGIAISYS